MLKQYKKMDDNYGFRLGYKHSPRECRILGCQAKLNVCVNCLKCKDHCTKERAIPHRINRDYNIKNRDNLKQQSLNEITN